MRVKSLMVMVTTMMLVTMMLVMRRMTLMTTEARASHLQQIVQTSVTICGLMAVQHLYGIGCCTLSTRYLRTSKQAVVLGTTELVPGSALLTLASLWTFARRHYSVVIRRIFAARCYASEAYAVLQCLSVLPSVRLSRS